MKYILFTSLLLLTLFLGDALLGAHEMMNSRQSQSVPNQPDPLLSLTWVNGPLTFINNHGQVFMTCQAAGPDPEDYYDCTLAPGHSLNEVIRLALRIQRDERQDHEKLVKEIMSKWKHSLDVISKTLQR